MDSKILTFILLFLLFVAFHYFFYSFYLRKTKNCLYGGTIGAFFLITGLFASLFWAALIISNNYKGLLLPVSAVPSALFALIMLIRIITAIFIKTSEKKVHVQYENRRYQESYSSLTRGRHYDYIINGYNNKTNPLITKRDYEIACIYSKKITIIEELKAQNKYYELAIFYLLQKNFKEAIKYFEMAGATNLTYEFFYNKALCLFYLNNFQEAVENYDKAIKFNPHPHAYFNRALAKARLHDINATAQDLKHVIQDKDVINAVKVKRKLDFIEKFISSN